MPLPNLVRKINGAQGRLEDLAGGKHIFAPGKGLPVSEEGLVEFPENFTVAARNNSVPVGKATATREIELHVFSLQRFSNFSHLAKLAFSCCLS